MSFSPLRAPWARTVVAAVVVVAGAVAVADPRPAAGAPEPVTFAASADARVEEKRASRNFDKEPLRVEYASKAAVMSYLKFTTAGLAAPVERATLRLRVDSDGSGEGASLHATGTGWTEKGLTWKNAPPRGALAASVSPLPAGSWVDFDVTSAVTGNGTFAFVLSKPSGSDGAALRSREQSNGPQLVITTVAGTAPTTSSSTSSSTTSSSPSSSTSTSSSTTTSSTTTTAPTASTTSTTLPPPDPGPLPVPATDTDWRPGDAYGGGYSNFVRFHPTDPDRVLLVTDVAGIHLSTDGGSTWLPRSRNVSDKVASVAWNPSRSNIAYALAGEAGGGTGGVMVSTDGGVTWAMSSTIPTGSANNTPESDGLPRPHPRSTGQLLAVDAPGGFLYAGTYKQGLMRARIGADGRPGAWTTVALAPAGGKPYFIRGIALDDVDPSVVYIATYGTSAGSGIGKVYRVAGAGGAAPVVEELTGGPRQAEELRALGGHLYAVANDNSGAGVGAFRLGDARSAPPAMPWRRIAAGPSVTTVTYYGLEIYKRGGTTTLWVTSDKSWRPGTDTAYKFLWRGTSADDFATDGSWTALPRDPGDTRNDVGGPNNPPRPFWTITDGTYGWPGVDPLYTASAVSVNPADPGTLLLAGQVAPWRTRDNGDTWYPVPTGVDILVHARVATDPAEPATVAVGSVDFRGFTSNDGLRTGRYVGLALKKAGVPGSAGETWAVAFDQAAPGPNRPVYYGVGDKSNDLGEVWMDLDPSTPLSGWTELMDRSVSGGKRPIGLAVVRNPAAPDVPVTLAVLQNGSMLRKIGHDPGTAWVPAANFTSPVATSWPQAVEFVWKPGMTKIYVYDRASGLWRSDDYGFSWTRLSASPNRNGNKQGFVAADPDNENIVYLSTSAGVSVVTDAATAAADAATLIPVPVPGGPPGPLAVGGDGRIYVATQPGAGHVGRIWGNRITVEGGVALPWQDLADDFWYHAINDTRELAVGGNGAVYVALSGGVFVLDDPKIPAVPD